MVILGVAIASAGIMALTALITALLVGKFWKSLTLCLLGAAASVATAGIVAILMLASQHRNAFASSDVQIMLGLIVVILWVLIAGSWFSVRRARSLANHA